MKSSKLLEALVCNWAPCCPANWATVLTPDRLRGTAEDITLALSLMPPAVPGEVKAWLEIAKGSCEKLRGTIPRDSALFGETAQRVFDLLFAADKSLRAYADLVGGEVEALPTLDAPAATPMATGPYGVILRDGGTSKTRRFNRLFPDAVNFLRPFIEAFKELPDPELPLSSVDFMAETPEGYFEVELEGFTLLDICAFDETSGKPFLPVDRLPECAAREPAATWAEEAMAAFHACVKGDRHDAMPDLLGDLMHLSDCLGIDFEEQLAEARTQYQLELEEK